tara:strand:- start:1852 stop:2391 length:540 start_codon:yes stop_codon:yes gene_type:complete
MFKLFFKKYFLSFILFLIIPIVGFVSIKFFEIDKFFYIIVNFFENNELFLILLVLIEIIVFIFNFPTTPFLILNISVFNYIGLLISLVALIGASILIYYFSNLLKSKTNNEKISIYKNKYLSNNLFIKILLSRFVIPFYFHNLLCGIIKIKLRTFLLIVFIVDFTGLFLLVFLNDIILS